MASFTIDQAARYLNVSEDYLIILLKTGALKSLNYKDLFQYDSKNKAWRAKALKELNQLCEEWGLAV